MKKLTLYLADKPFAGTAIGVVLILTWGSLLGFALSRPLIWTDPMIIFLIWGMTHLYTGLFITAHDAMHGTVAKNKLLNAWMGRICTFLFMFNNYDLLRTKHYLHHRFPGTDQDPDFHREKAGFWFWYGSFLRQYLDWKQFLAAAITFNVAGIWIDKPKLVLFWIIPSALSTLQLFYFGTFVPHMGEHAPENKHRASSQNLNHLKAFLTCYFFGYHYEHHELPRTPWWLLWRTKEQLSPHTTLQ
ncbi:fatty acid desaturase [Pontibacter sp. G13]|uniref:fatty acid desaturase n=1 Tax=Pontibacter sp. G13 TaxID=3074898 RepID=UPI002889A2AE|nr:fatty acid desaturase [Pontibacter sp. G13]WNJ21124.1 fatty acid desaturase [Pontibacter sp. G13]